jgi:hypothetical protein
MGPNEMIRNLLRIEGDFDFFQEFIHLHQFQASCGKLLLPILVTITPKNMRYIGFAEKLFQQTLNISVDIY